MTLLHIYVVKISGYFRPVIFHLLQSLMFSHALLISILLTYEYSKAAKLFVILSWLSPLTFPSISLFILNHSTTNFCAYSLCTDTAPLNSATTIQWPISHSAPLKYLTTVSPLDLSMCEQCHYVFQSGPVQVCLWLFWCCSTVFLTIKFINVAKFTILTPLVLLFTCQLSSAIYMSAVIPKCWCVKKSSPQYSIKISQHNFYMVHSKAIKSLL